MEPFDYDRWLSTPPEPYTEPEEDEDEAYDSWIDRQLCEMDLIKEKRK